jgi:hypothetical protein
MTYLTIIAAVWAICALFAVLFIRGASMHDEKLIPVPVSDGERTLGKGRKDLSRIV